LVVELLTTTSSTRAHELTRFLEGQNSDRQKIEHKTLTQAQEMVALLDLDCTPALVLARPDWHPGVIGIVAGRLVEIYARPVLMIALREEPAVGQGSGRSVPGFLLHKALGACGEFLISHGGHAAAAGFKIQREQVDTFRQQFCSFAADHFPQGPAAPRLIIDAEVSLSMLTPGLIETLAHLEPYGAGNPRPRFLAGPVQVLGKPRRVGKGERHLQFRVQQQGTQIPAIGFGLADRAEEIMSSRGQCFLVFTPNFNEWQGRRTIQLEVTDFQPGTQAKLA
jgi:single-stranded-DNA-specific exonuclease